VTYRIDERGCINCGWCRRACPTATIFFFLSGRRAHVIDPDGCIDCGICARVCPVDVIVHDPAYEPPAPLREAAKERARGWAAGQRRARERRRERAAAVAATLRVRRLVTG